MRILNGPEAARDHVLDALQHNSNIEFAEFDTIVSPDLTPNDPYYVYNYQWHLNKIAAPAAWDVTTGSSSVIIAILDTGIDSTHPDQAGNLVTGWNAYSSNSDTTQVYPHGSAVAGTAAAIGNNGTGVASLAWGCKLMPIRVSDTNGYANSSVIANDNIGVTKVDLMIDGKLYSTSTSATPVFTWNTSKLSRGQHTLQSIAYDAAGNKGSSTVVTVNK